MLATGLRVSRVGALMRRLPIWNGVIVLTYHRVGDAARSDLYRGVFSATADEFEHHVRFLRREFDLIGPGDLSPELLGRGGRHVLLSFDDGYRDLYEVVDPILRSNGAHAVMFLCSGFIDGHARAWWDDIAWLCRHTALPVLPVGPWAPVPLSLSEAEVDVTINLLVRRYWELPPSDASAFLTQLAKVTDVGSRPSPDKDWITWEMARELQAAGHEIGAHTATHPVLARLSRAEQLREIVSGRERLDEELGRGARWLAYPVGTRVAFDEVTREVAYEAEMELAFSNYGGFVTRENFAKFDVRRLPVESLRTFDLFSASLTWPARLAPQ